MNGASRLDRRAFLGAAAGILLASDVVAQADKSEEHRGTLIVRGRDPDNLEMPFESLDGFLTPSDRFYVRNHFTTPVLNADTWKLEIAGAVKKPLHLTFDDLLKLPARTAAVTLECAGNGRQLLEQKVKGVQWTLGAVGTAEWTGVPLATVLERAGIDQDAVDVVFEGADRGEPGTDPKPGGPIPFARGLPVAKALRPEVLLAYQMNGKPLTARHGYPVRALVGGWYGMAAVKWLTRIVVTDRRFRGYGESIDYAIWDRRYGPPSLTPVTEIDVKASIARPMAGATVPAGKDVRVHGAAWAGGADIATVEVSTDAGANWAAARLVGQAIPFAWRLWEYDWKAPAAGRHTLMARATDSRGRVQPMRRDLDRRSYMINHVIPTPVEAKA
jgi:DMSO/TMAO reductase YedYZ molybdopterin-dependent catalytic subunit